MPLTATIASAFALYTLSTTFSEEVAEDLSVAFTQTASAALQQGLAIPASNFDEVRMKITALISDAGCGLVAAEDLAFVARDLDLLLGASVQ